MPLEVEMGKILVVSKNILSKLGNLEKTKFLLKGKSEELSALK